MATVSPVRQYVHSDPPAPQFPRLAGDPEACPWYYRLPTDPEMTPALVAELNAYLDRVNAELDAEAAACELSARADEAGEEVAGSDVTGFTLCGTDTPRELRYEPEQGVLFVNDFEPPYEPAYL